MNALQASADAMGGASALARAIGVSNQRLSNWGERGVPPEQCAAIERATNGAVTCDQLRPDVAWSRIPDDDWPHPGGRPVIDIARKEADRAAA